MVAVPQNLLGTEGSSMWQSTYYGVSVFIVLLSMIGAWLQYWGININYGRGSNSLVNIYVSPKLAWFLWQIPNLIVAAYFLYGLRYPLTWGYLLFIIHYINRVIIYPLSLTSTTTVPVEILIAGAVFTSANGYLQAISNTKGNQTSIVWMFIGTAIFVLGMGINIYSDSILRKAKKEVQKMAEKQLKQETPRSVLITQKYRRIDDFLFIYVSNPNYLGEVIQWFGYYIVCQTTQSLLFALSTLIILTAFAKNRNEWSKKNIFDYPKTRKAIIPFIV